MLLSDHCGDRGDLGRGGGGSGVHPAVVGGMCESWLCHRAPVSHEGVTPGGDTERWCGAVTRSAATSRQARNSGGRGRRRGLICATQKRCARVSCRCKRHGEPPRRGEGPGRHADVAQLARASPCHGEGREFESRHPLASGPPHLGGPRCVGPCRCIPPRCTVRGPPKTGTVGWPSGEAAACKAVYAGSIPVPTSQDRIGPHSP